ncbi:tetratricopeptide repeat protein [Deinococcus multiflagellatus]|uniref:Tetratricopeptide repeat protein n=1 Tax=Deinococcus multiflagellatus TaxID=1656887 RepID=A0ABW1ZJX4_9DEIO
MLAPATLAPGAQARLAAPASAQPTLRLVAETLLTPDAVIALMNEGRLGEAEAATRAALAAHPESARSLLMLARIQARQGDLGTARATLKRAEALPQWTEQALAVPFEAPGDIEAVMLRDQPAARGLLADVLLAQGDDPKAYYLLAMTEALAQRWDASRAALAQARALAPALPFADPQSLASLERALGSGQPPQVAGPVITPDPTSPWEYLTWIVVAGVLGRTMWKATRQGKEQAARRKAQIAAATAEAARLQTQLARELNIPATTPEERQRRTRLQALAAQVDEWYERAQAGALDPQLLNTLYGQLLAAAQSDEAYAAYQQQLARGGAWESRRDSPSSLNSTERDSWSSGSGSSSGNAGGSKW